MDRGIEKYLEHYAEAEARTIRSGLEALGGASWDEVVVIPARQERLRSLLAVTASLPANRQVLTIVIVNGSEGSLPENRELLKALLGATEGRRIELLAAPSTWLGWIGARGFLIIDRDSEGQELGAKQGVGKARKIGCDVALTLQVAGVCRGSWIHSTDADACLPSDYFDDFETFPSRVVGRVAPLWHEPGGDAPVDEATARYELWLRYYVLGLAWAASPYAFQTVGSLISVRSSAYAAVRGFPRRQAGEDFYLLNKLRKLGELRSGSGEAVRLRSRISMRVPFGTGPAVKKLCDGEPLRVHDPHCFAILKRVLGGLEDLAVRAESEESPTMDCSELPEIARCHLERGGMFKAWERLARHQRGAALRQQLHAHFDAFRTLKFIHHLRDRSLPSLVWEEACARAEFVGGLTGREPLEEQRRRLAELETRRPVISLRDA